MTFEEANNILNKWDLDPSEEQVIKDREAEEAFNIHYFTDSLCESCKRSDVCVKVSHIVNKCKFYRKNNNT